MWKSTLTGITLALAVAAGPALAEDTTVRWLHIESNPETLELWNQVVADYEAANPGVKVEIQHLENEAFKAKLPTLLQSDDRPHVFYSWSGGVMRAQDEAGFLADVTEGAKDWTDRFSSGAAAAFEIDGKIVGAPNHLSEVVFFYNKDLIDQAGVDIDAIQTWDDFLAAVKQVKEAGITPIMVGGGEKWPMHFYWSYLVMRIGGADALADARAEGGEGFNSEVFVQAGERLQELAELEPFQDGWLATMFPQSAGLWGDGEGAFHLMGGWILNTQRNNATDGVGLTEDKIGIFSFPIVEGGKGEKTATLGGINGWLITEGAPPEAIDFVKHLLQPEYQRIAAEKGFYIPANLGTDDAITSELSKRMAEDLSASTYHQIFFDQDLGPSVGRVVNDISVAVAAGDMAPEEGAEAVQEAWEQR
ncbi:MAG: carbohydrate ABC transporter substrate-binding protein [Hyphomicrobiales bacterium]|nr:carbohydrate ABC transporter substrate-binding protein [Hyphomicrobiales bacterium]